MRPRGAWAPRNELPVPTRAPPSEDQAARSKALITLAKAKLDKSEYAAFIECVKQMKAASVAKVEPDGDLLRRAALLFAGGSHAELLQGLLRFLPPAFVSQFKTLVDQLGQRASQGDAPARRAPHSQLSDKPAADPASADSKAASKAELGKAFMLRAREALGDEARFAAFKSQFHGYMDEWRRIKSLPGTESQLAAQAHATRCAATFVRERPQLEALAPDLTHFLPAEFRAYWMAAVDAALRNVCWADSQAKHSTAQHSKEQPSTAASAATRWR